MLNYNILNINHIKQKIICYVFTIILLLPQILLAEPDWLNLYLNGGFNMQDKYHGINFAKFSGRTPGYDEIELARKRAIDDLSYCLSVNIKSSLKENLSQKGQFSEENVESSLFVSTRLVLSGVKPEKNWTDKRNKKYWVLVFIDKDIADKQVKEQNFLNEVINRLEKNQNEIRNGIDIITKTLIRKMEIHANRLNQIESLIQKVDGKIIASGNKTKQEYNKILQNIKLMVNTKNEQELFLKKALSSRDKKIDLLLKQNEKLFELFEDVSKNINKDYFLSFVNSDLNYNNKESKFQIQIVPDRGHGADYYENERIRFQVKSTKDCYIKVYYLSSDKNGKIATLLLPNQEDRNNKVIAGQIKIIGQYGELAILKPFGKDVITVIASEKQFPDINNYKYMNKYVSNKVSNTRDAIKVRAVGVVTPSINSSGISELNINYVASDTCFIVSHGKVY